MTSNSPQHQPSTESKRDTACSHCGEEIEGQPLYPARDIESGEDGLQYVENPDGPFCDIECRRAHDE